jgi:hypothetical protein
MKSGLASILAVGVGVAAILAYWYVPRQSARATSNPVADRNVAPLEEAATTEPAASGLKEMAAKWIRGDDHPTPPARLVDALAQRSRFARSQALLEIAATSDMPTLYALAADADGLESSLDRHETLQAVLTRLFELDPQNAPKQVMSETLAQASSPKRNEKLASIGAAWAMTAPEVAWAHSRTIADPAARAAFEQSVINTWSMADPEAAFAGVVAIPANDRKDRLLFQAAAALARADPRRAVQIASGVNRADRRNALWSIVSEWGQHDPHAAAQWLEANPGKVNRDMVAHRFASRYGAVNPVEALSWAQRIESAASARHRDLTLVGLVLTGYAEESPEDALRLALGLDAGEQRNAAVGAVLGAIARRDPGYAMAHLDKLPKGQQRSNAILNMAMQVSRSDPRAAVEWIKTAEEEGNDNEHGRSLVSALGHVLADSDPETAMSLTEQIPEKARGDWIVAVAAAYARQDPEAALRWARQYQNDPAYPRMTSELAGLVADSDPQMAMDFASSVLDARERDRTIARVVEQVSHQDPALAARWVERVRDDQERLQAIGNIAMQWAHTDSSAARKWVMSLPSGASRDQGITALMRTGVVPSDQAETLISQIQSPQHRMDAVLGVVVQLAQSDIDGARTLLRRHPLDPQRQEQLTMHLRQAGITL